MSGKIDKFRKLKFNGVDLIKEDTIKKIQKINDFNMDYYYKYVKKSIETCSTKSSFGTKNSKILHFLTNRKINNKKLTELNQKDIDEYLSNRIGEEQPATYENRVSILINLFELIDIGRDLVFERSGYTRSEIDNEMNNKAIVYSCTQIEEIRKFYKFDYMKLLFFELMYRKKLQANDIERINFDSCDLDKRFITIKNKKISIEPDLCELIAKLKEDYFFNGYNDVGAIIEKMKNDLKDNGITQNFKYSDLKQTRQKRTHITCPECGKKVEGLAKEWCVKEYEDTGNLWLVCKKCGENYAKNKSS